MDPSANLESAKEWDNAIKLKRKTLFGVSRDGKDGSLHARIMSLGNQKVAVGQLNSEVGTWANLSFELLYLTNDDDERYSIQAHEALFRNIITQAADPPLGYPVWYSTSQIDSSTGILIRQTVRHLQSLWMYLSDFNQWKIKTKQEREISKIHPTAITDSNIQDSKNNGHEQSDLEALYDVLEM
ncbi:hypothetical protein SeLEV6574_g08423 [Synchytrium endobioticum]|uniref:Pecanex C-terminal domain-containing protein n=1 Tax=Synchytrium endobioticum TaxID=286115 RepID=A0A507C1M0_9FUNG|nr:hypothetical protein SeLEV6574_g08423 [Synchytrium endobioticum]